MSSSGSWSMIARATVSPPTPESKTPTGALNELTPNSCLERAGPLAFAGLAFGRRQQVRRDDAGERAAQMTLPGHAAALAEHRHRPEQDATVDEQDHQPDDDVPDPADEQPENQQEGQVAEDQ